MPRILASLLMGALALSLPALAADDEAPAKSESESVQKSDEKKGDDQKKGEEKKTEKPGSDKPGAEKTKPDKTADKKPTEKKPTDKNTEKTPEKSGSKTPEKTSPDKTNNDKTNPEKVPSKTPPEKTPAKTPEKGTTKPADKSTVQKPGFEKKPGAEKNAPEKAGSEKNEIAITPAREEAAMTFAREHHPELAELLDQLKKRDKVEYGRAVRELFQTSEKLAKVKERSPERHDAAVAGWKIDSRIRLLSARMVMADNPDLQAELTELLRQRADLRLEELRAERARLASRIEKIDEDISAIEKDPKAAVQRELQKVRFQVSEQTRAMKETIKQKKARDKID